MLFNISVSAQLSSNPSAIHGTYKKGDTTTEYDDEPQKHAHEQVNEAGIEIDLDNNGHGNEENSHPAMSEVGGLKGEDEHQRQQQRPHHDGMEFG